MKKTLYNFALLILVTLFASCSNNKVADLVVYGSVYTANDEAPQAEAFAVKDGVYVYVGTVKGAEDYVGKETVVIDHRNKGMITPGFYDNHAHYLMQEAIKTMGAVILSENMSKQEVLNVLANAYNEAKKQGKPGIYGFGWSFPIFEMNGMPTLEELDKACPDIPLYASDSEGHKGLANTACMRNAGIIKDDGTLAIKQIKGGEIVVDAQNRPTGLLKEQAGTYCKLKGIDFNTLLDKETALKTVQNVCSSLQSKGIISYMDGWSNYYGNTRFYEAANELDKNGKLNICLGLSYEIESSNSDPMGELSKAFHMTDFSSTHVNTNYIKLFADGTVETRTGYVNTPYLNGTFGIPNWTDQELADITAKANAENFTMHVHTMGDKAVHMTINAFANAGKKSMRNTLVHVCNIKNEDYKVLADNNIVCAVGILWHVFSENAKNYLSKIVPPVYAEHMYPMRSFLDNGVTATSHSDYPALSGASEKPFYIMEIGVTCKLPESNDNPYWTAEKLTRIQALKMLTINGAYQMHNEKERGDIQVGKFADFVIVDKDVMNEKSCPENEIHKANVLSTYFEGNLVYKAK